jgi:hypothetical protein
MDIKPQIDDSLAEISNQVPPEYKSIAFGHELCRLACDVRKSGVLNVTHYRWVDTFRRHTVTSQKTSVFSNTILRTSHLAGSLCSRNGVLREAVDTLYGVGTSKWCFNCAVHRADDQINVRPYEGEGRMC